MSTGSRQLGTEAQRIFNTGFRSGHARSANSTSERRFARTEAILADQVIASSAIRRSGDVGTHAE